MSAKLDAWNNTKTYKWYFYETQYRRILLKPDKKWELFRYKCTVTDNLDADQHACLHTSGV